VLVSQKFRKSPYLSHSSFHSRCPNCEQAMYHVRYGVVCEACSYALPLHAWQYALHRRQRTDVCTLSTPEEESDGGE
jgi:ribosomal protein L37E